MIKFPSFCIYCEAKKEVDCKDEFRTRIYACGSAVREHLSKPHWSHPRIMCANRLRFHLGLKPVTREYILRECDIAQFDPADMGTISLEGKP